LRCQSTRFPSTTLEFQVAWVKATSRSSTARPHLVSGGLSRFEKINLSIDRDSLAKTIRASPQAECTTNHFKHDDRVMPTRLDVGAAMQPHPLDR
jgi:hypothetical protein